MLNYNFIRERGNTHTFTKKNRSPLNPKRYKMDILIYIVFATGAIVGIVQGAFKQIASIIGVIAGIVLAILLYDKYGEQLAVSLGTEVQYGQIIAFILIVIIVPLALGWLATLLTKLFSAIKLGWINRLVGMAIGALSYGLIMSVAFNIMDLVVSSGGTKLEKLETRSELYYHVKHASHPILPEIIIVTDNTETKSGYKPHKGLADKLPKDFPFK